NGSDHAPWSCLLQFQFDFAPVWQRQRPRHPKRGDVHMCRRHPTAPLIEHLRHLADPYDMRRTVHGTLDGASHTDRPYHLLNGNILLPRQRPGAERPASDEIACPVWLTLLHIHAHEVDA